MFLIYLIINHNKMFSFAENLKKLKWQLTEHLQ